MEYVITADRKYRNDWSMLVNEMNAQAYVRAGAFESEETPCTLYFSAADPKMLSTVCLPVAVFALSAVAPPIIAADVRSSPEEGLTIGLEPETVEAIAKAGALRHTKWLDIAADRMAQSLTENPALSIEGFLRFRMRDLLDTLHNELRSLLGALNIEEEYRRFMDLLKRYAATNRNETEKLTVHFDPEGGYTLFTTSGRRLLSVPWQMNGKKSGSMLITLLNSIAPAIVLVRGNTYVPENIRKTICDMFGERVLFNS